MKLFIRNALTALSAALILLSSGAHAFAGEDDRILTPLIPVAVPTEDDAEEPETETETKAEKAVTSAPAAAGVLCGDISGDGFINIRDATLLQRYLAGEMTFDDRQLAAASIPGTEIGGQTVTELRRYPLGLPADPHIGTII